MERLVHMKEVLSFGKNGIQLGKGLDFEAVHHQTCTVDI